MFQLNSSGRQLRKKCGGSSTLRGSRSDEVWGGRQILERHQEYTNKWFLWLWKKTLRCYVTTSKHAETQHAKITDPSDSPWRSNIVAPVCVFLLMWLFNSSTCNKLEAGSHFFNTFRDAHIQSPQFLTREENVALIQELIRPLKSLV